MKVLISLNDSLLNKLDEYIKENGYTTRSGCIAELIRPAVFKNQKLPEVKRQFNAVIRQKEEELQTVNESVKKVSIKPAVNSSINPFAICPRHKVFYQSCGCTK